MQAAAFSPALSPVSSKLSFSIACCIVAALIGSLHADVFYYSHDTPKWLVFDIALSAYTIYSLLYLRPIFKLNPLTIITLVVTSYAAFSLLFAPNFFAGLEYTYRLALTFMAIHCLIHHLSSERLTQLFINSTFFATLCFSVTFIAERYILKTPFNLGTFSPAGYLNHAGQMFNIWIPLTILFAYFHRKSYLLVTLAVATILIQAYILIEAATRGTIVGLTVCEIIIFAIAIRKNKKQALLFLTISTLIFTGIGLFKFSDHLHSGRLEAKLNALKSGVNSAANGRLQMFQNTFDMAIDNPFGVGANNFEYVHPLYAKPGTSSASPFVNEKQVLKTPHNYLLKQFSELGYLGLLCFSMLYIAIAWLALRNAIRGSIVDKWLFVAVGAVLFHSLLSSVFLTPGSLFFSAFLFAVIISRGSQKICTAPKIQIHPSAAFIVLIIPVVSISLCYSEYLAYRGRTFFNKELTQQAIRFNPGNERAWFLLALIERNSYRNTKASLEATEQFLLLYPNSIAGRLLKAKNLLSLNQLESAQKTIDHLIQFYPGSTDAKKIQDEIQRKMLSNNQNMFTTTKDV